MKIIQTFILLLLFFSFIQNSFANIRIRAREHFDVFQVNANEKTDTYFGLGPIINIWYEQPYLYSIGIALGATFLWDNNNENLGSEIQIYDIGLEYKLFPFERINSLYLRLGTAFSILDNNLYSESLYGESFYAGCGFEFDMDTFGLALEAAFRYYNFEKEVSMISLSPSIGFHFYKHL